MLIWGVTWGFSYAAYGKIGGSHVPILWTFIATAVFGVIAGLLFLMIYIPRQVQYRNKWLSGGIKGAMVGGALHLVYSIMLFSIRGEYEIFVAATPVIITGIALGALAGLISIKYLEQ